MIDLRLDGMTRRLNTRWKGLLEIDRALWTAGNLSERAHQTVQYLHRTVKDFIRSKKVHEFLQSSLSSQFDPHLSLCVAHYAYIKALPASAVLAQQVRLCLWYAARVLPSSEKDMTQMLDDMASTLPTMYATYKLSPNLPAERFENYLWARTLCLPRHELGPRDAPWRFRRYISLTGSDPWRDGLCQSTSHARVSGAKAVL